MPLGHQVAVPSSKLRRIRGTGRSCITPTGSKATVFAGAGIVAGSDPEKEHTETSTKLQTFINALG
ncbi:hypothetical protein C5748_25080 [Phyllobacterium phragmitis]|uniref:Chorismate-utilising enzyme C-terminal domain-containing protein n=1 Tax=Phyllobacterium phragmitis TaxID=2670329 RepID=A0A2S9IJX8_9HYPH|nr:hypothetical protein C5748_25080 [Phyllobacterium phragmitis]